MPGLKPRSQSGAATQNNARQRTPPRGTARRALPLYAKHNARKRLTMTLRTIAAVACYFCLVDRSRRTKTLFTGKDAFVWMTF